MIMIMIMIMIIVIPNVIKIIAMTMKMIVF